MGTRQNPSSDYVLETVEGIVRMHPLPGNRPVVLHYLCQYVKVLINSGFPSDDCRNLLTLARAYYTAPPRKELLEEYAAAIFIHMLKTIHRLQEFCHGECMN